MKTDPNRGRLVYSTEGGTMCPACRRPVAQCACAQPRLAGAADGIVRVSRESKGRGGKTVTLVRGLALDPAALAELARQLKATCGSGGTVKDGTIELQGEHRDAVVKALTSRGWATRRSGG